MTKIGLTKNLGGCTGSGLLFANILTVAVGLIGFTVAVYYPCMVSFSSEWVKMSGKYMGIFAVGQAW